MDAVLLVGQVADLVAGILTGSIPLPPPSWREYTVGAVLLMVLGSFAWAVWRALNAVHTDVVRPLAAAVVDHIKAMTQALVAALHHLTAHDRRLDNLGEQVEALRAGKPGLPPPPSSLPAKPSPPAS